MRLKELIEYRNGGGVSLDGTDPDIQGFHSELINMFPDTYVTSGLRKGSGVGKLGSKSRHNRGQAIDLAPNAKVKAFLMSNDGVALLNKYNLGFLDETGPSTMKKTGATGAHYHIGKDSTLVGKNHNHSHSGEYESQQYVNNTGNSFVIPDGPLDFNTLPSDVQSMYLDQQKAATQLQQAELKRKEIEEQNAQLNAVLTQKMMERKQMFSMIPQAQMIDEKQQGNEYTQLLTSSMGNYMQKGGIVQKMEEGGQSWDKMSSTQRRDYIYNSLIKRGYNNIQAAAVVGNLQQENGSFGTTRLNEQGSGAIGLAQWLGPRRELLKKNYKDWYNIDSQIDFLDKELKDNLGGAWANNTHMKNKFFQTNSLEEATKLIRVGFERPGNHEANDTARLNFAKSVLGNYGSNQGSNSSHNPMGGYSSERINTSIGGLNIPDGPVDFNSLSPEIQQSIKEQLKYNQEAYMAEIKKQETDAINAQLDLQLKQKQAERVQMQSMIPKAQAIDEKLSNQNYKQVLMQTPMVQNI